MWLYSQSKLEDHTTGKGDLWITDMMPLTYVSFSYLSKVNLGRKVVHWTRTLSQDSCSLYEPMYPTHLSPLLLSCPYLFIGLGNWVGGDEENANYRGTPAQFFFSVLDFGFFFKPPFLPGVALKLFSFISPSPNPT